MVKSPFQFLDFGMHLCDTQVAGRNAQSGQPAHAMGNFHEGTTKGAQKAGKEPPEKEGGVKRGGEGNREQRSILMLGITDLRVRILEHTVHPAHRLGHPRDYM